MHRDIRILVEDLLDKWRDVRDTSDDSTERTLADEVIDDLKSVMRCLTTN